MWSRLDDPATMQAAIDASRRLGRPALALAAAVWPGRPASPRLLRLVDAVDVTPADAAASSCRSSRTRTVASPSPPSPPSPATARQIEAPTLDRLLAEDVVLRRRARRSDDDDRRRHLVRRALDDLLGVFRDRVLAVLAVRHGEERIAGARHALSSPDATRRALGIEMLQVSIPRAEAALVDPVVRDDLEDRASPPLATLLDVDERERAGWLADLALDPASRWRSPWLQAVALYAELVSAPPSPLDTHANWPSPRNPRRRRLQRSPSSCSPRSARTAHGREEDASPAD